MTVRRLAQLSALALAALTLWGLIVGSEVGPSDPFALEIYASFAVIVVIVFATGFYALRFATAGSEMYWRMNGKNQVRPVLWLILAILTFMFAVGWLLEEPGRLEPFYAAEASYLLAGTLVPAGFLYFRWVAWPVRSRRPATLSLVLISIVGIGFASAWSYVAYVIPPDRLPLLPVGPMLATLGALIVGATAEEIVFRVLLLTAMLSAGESRFQAVFLSSMAFALMHVPGQLYQPVMTADWALMRDVAGDYATGFVAQFAIGLFLGVLWLRTGSITLIAATHAMINTGKVLALGL